MKFEKQSNDPRAEIEAIRAEICTGGAVDSETGAIRTILEELNKGDITGEEAVARARDLRDSRNDYH